MSGFLYVLKSGEWHKIGIAQDVGGRVADLQTGNPIKIELTIAYQMNVPGAAEALIHDHFKDRRGIGEWFQLSRDDLDFIDTFCLMFGGIITKVEPVEIGDDDFESEYNLTRAQFLSAWNNSGSISIAELARGFGINPRTAQRWIKQDDESGQGE